MSPVDYTKLGKRMKTIFLAGIGVAIILYAGWIVANFLTGGN